MGKMLVKVFFFFLSHFTLYALELNNKMEKEESESDCDSECDFGNLFKSRDPSSAVFYFTAIVSTYIEDSDETEITFHYNYAREVDIFSKVFVSGRIDLSPSSKLIDIIVSIGMCSMTWYW